MVIPRRWTRWLSLAPVLFVLAVVLVVYREETWMRLGPDLSAGNFLPATMPQSAEAHPIDHLISGAQSKAKSILERRSSTVADAAARYRQRRGRHPPPGFDAWFDYARKTNAIIVEDFFDRIYHDINPFWALKPRDLRVQTNTQPQLIRVRKGKVHFETDNPKRPPWIQKWTELVTEFGSHLPDLDMVVNVMDETRILVPWEKIAQYHQTELESRRLADPKDTVQRYSGLADVDAKKEPFEHRWITSEANKFWDHLRAACPPDTPARNVSALPSFDRPVEYPSGPMPYTYQGYIQNFTASQDPCFQPHLRGMHGTFVESISMSTTHELMPMFAGCKLPWNNEILIPGGMYLDRGNSFYDGGWSHGSAWDNKRNGLIWRGAGSGGRNKEDNWWHFHRHRWVQMMNGSTVDALENGDRTLARTFSLLSPETYRVPAQAKGRLGKWLSMFSDVGFVDLECFPAVMITKKKKSRACSYTDKFMAVMKLMPMRKQYDYKYLPDVDGNSYSARWRSFLQSTSMPLKATIYTEWHDDRLVPWAHFAPFDNSFMDIYGVMDYFINGHDKQARRIAEEGRDWANSVLRREDMALYVWRLLLEYARVVDDNRDRLAFVNDLR